MLRALRLACHAVLLCLCALPAVADTPPPRERWNAPFGGQWHAYVNVESDYAQSGISSTQLRPAFQAGLDYQTPRLLGEGYPRLWAYAYIFGSNVSFPNAGDGVELDFAGGLKMRLMEGKLGLSGGYIRYTFPDIAASFGLEYGEVDTKLDYDFGPAYASFRLRWSPAGLGGVGETWNKRVLMSAPLSFLKLPFEASMQVYGTVGNNWVARPAAVGLPGNDYWYWQVGVVTSVWGLDITVAYTDTNIEPEGCGNTRYCTARAFLSVSKVF